MPITAIVKVRSLTASVNYRRLNLSASLLPELGNQISFRKVTGVVNWKNLYLHDIHVNVERTVYTFADEFGFSDAAILLPNKGLSDSLGFLSVDPVFTVGKQLSDSANIVDSTIMHPNKGVIEPVNLSEAMVFAANTGLLDSVGFVENVDTLLTFIRTFTTSGNDSHIMVDVLSLEPNKSISDSYGVSDVARMGPNKGALDTLSTLDTQSFSVGSAPSSGMAILDQISASRQPYNFIFSQFGNATNVSGEPDDSFTMSESPLEFDAAISLEDFYTLDDFAQVDKAVGGVKSNVVSMSDSLVFDHYVTGSILNQTLVGAMVLNG